MNAQEISDIQESYEKLTKAIADAIQDDMTLVDEGDRWLAHLIKYDDIRFFSTNESEGTLRGHAGVWTVQTGGSHEIAEFIIPLDTLNKYL